MLRSLIVMALLASLFYLVSHLQPAAESVAPVKVAASRQDRPPEGTPDEATGGFNPAVVAPLPDVNKGYIFSEKREVEKDVPVGTGKDDLAEQGPDLLASVVYSGSVIAGDLRRALVLYQEQPALPRRLPSGRSQAPTSSPGAIQKKQLNQGDRFLGYLVEAIEADRIVFAKGERKVEKFLYDRDKQRMGATSSGQQEVSSGEVGRVPLQAMAPPEVLEALMMASPPSRRPDSGAVVGGSTPGSTSTMLPPKAMTPPEVLEALRTVSPPSQRPTTGASPAGNVGGTNSAAQIQANRVVRRSQRLLGLDPSIDVPVTPVPGRPAQNN